MSEFDDPILRDRLSRYAGAPPDSDVAYVGVQRTVRHVRRRRVAIWGGAAAVVIGVGAANALQGPDGAKVTVPPVASTPVASAVATSTSTTSTSTTSLSTTATSTTATTAVTTIATATTLPVAPEVTNPETTLGNPDSGGDAATAKAGAPPTESATASRPTTLPAGGEKHHRSAVGGTVGIRLVNGSLSLVSATPNEGYAVHVDDDTGSRIRVVFERRATSSMVTATVVDGEIRFRVWERGGDQDDTSRNNVRDDDRDDDRDNDDDGRDNDDDGRDDNDDRDDDRRDRVDDGRDNRRDGARGDDTGAADD